MFFICSPHWWLHAWTLECQEKHSWGSSIITLCLRISATIERMLFPLQWTRCYPVLTSGWFWDHRTINQIFMTPEDLPSNPSIMTKWSASTAHSLMQAPWKQQQLNNSNMYNILCTEADKCLGCWNLNNITHKLDVWSYNRDLDYWIPCVLASGLNATFNRTSCTCTWTNNYYWYI